MAFEIFARVAKHSSALVIALCVNSPPKHINLVLGPHIQGRNGSVWLNIDQEFEPLAIAFQLVG